MCLNSTDSDTWYLSCKNIDISMMLMYQNIEKTQNDIITVHAKKFRKKIIAIIDKIIDCEF